MNATTATQKRAVSLRYCMKLRPYIDTLGTKPDKDIAALAGVSCVTVHRYRVLLGIGPFRMVNAIHDHRHLLGVLSDAKVAALAGVNRAVVTTYRNRLGIHAAPRVPPPPKPEGCRRPARPTRDRAPFAAMLGTAPDRVVAEAAGVHMATARQWRVDAGIPPFRKRGAPFVSDETDDEKRGRILEAKRRRSAARREQTKLAVTLWAAAWDDEHDRPFLATDYADAVGINLVEAVRRLTLAVRRGQITEIDRHRPGVCGCYVVGA